MEKFDIEPRRKLSSPISGLTDKEIVTANIPDISLVCHNYLTPDQFRPNNGVSNNQRQSKSSTKNQHRSLTKSVDNNNLKLLKPIIEYPREEFLNKRDNDNDMRFKFYQRLKESNKIIPVYSRNIPSIVEPIYKHISGHLQQNNNKIKSLKLLNSPYSNDDYKNDYKDNYNNIKLLVSLIQSQHQQIKSLNIQINALISIHQKEKLNKKQIKLTVNEDAKISIGVMTSLEFTLKKKLNEPLNNYSSEPKINDLMPFRVFNNKSKTNSNDDKNIEDYGEGNNESDYCLAIDNYKRPMGKVSSKIGWTFYNNMMCQVNELLDTQNDNIQSQQKKYNPQQSFINDNRQQRSIIQQWKILKTAMTTGFTDDKIFPTDERMNYDSSYYPKVNYQTNIVQTTNSIIDDNTSIHMRALALKYLGHNYMDNTNLQTLTKLISNMSTPVNNGHKENF